MIAAAAGLIAASYMSWYIERFEREMVYPFDGTYATPLEAGEPRLAEERFRQADGTEVILWISNATADKPTVLYFPGNAGSLRNRAARFGALIDGGYGLVAMSYRGSSGSEGEPSEVLLTQDALAVARSIKAERLVLYGESLGTSLAVKLAAQGIGDAVVLEAPFTSIVDVVTAQFPLDDLEHLVTQRWASIGFADAVRQPLLVIHGTEDRVVPFELGERLFKAIGSPAKQFLRIEGGEHSGLWTVEMQTTLRAFLDGL